MTWLQRYHLKRYIRDSIWIFPALSIILGLVTVALLSRLEHAMGWELNLTRDTARDAIDTIVASVFSMVVMVTSALLVAVQLASAQLTPRVITLVYRNIARKISLCIFVFTFAFSV